MGINALGFTFVIEIKHTIIYSLSPVSLHEAPYSSMDNSDGASFARRIYTNQSLQSPFDPIRSWG